MSPMRAFRRIVPLLLLLVTALAALAGCGLKGTLKPDVPPTTTLFVRGPVDTVNHLVHLYWFGSDVDGTIQGYEVRFFNPVRPADTNWVFTVRTDSIIAIPTPSGFTSARFEVRAIDNSGERDPNPAKQVFNFFNKPPVVRLTVKPSRADRSDTTFASVTVSWSVADIDGDPSHAVSRVWLDGQAGDPIVVNGTHLTLPSSRFFTSGSSYSSGPRTLYVQATDDGGMLSNVDSVTWYVRQPVSGTRARLLIIDDVPSNAPSNNLTDNFIASAVAAKLPVGTYSILRLDKAQPFKSSLDVSQTLAQFESVIWYRGIIDTFSTWLTSYQDGIGTYLDGGGMMYLESERLAQSIYSSGALTPDFVSRYLDASAIFHFGLLPDSSASWSFNLGSKLDGRSIDDSLSTSITLGGLRGFVVRDPAEILFSADTGALSPANPIPMAVALNVPQKNSGRLVASSFPVIAGVNPFATQPFPPRGTAVMGKILDLIGLGGP